jgi:hypothetical protein
VTATARCLCPSLPVFARSAQLDGLPLACACCGSPLELTCRGCRPDGPPKRAKGTMAARMYAAKACKRCGALFGPTGPRQIYCGRPTCAVPT